MNIKYPFDPFFKHHVYIALGLALWIFLFLFFTEPLDVNQLSSSEKFIYLLIYGCIGGICYATFLPLQSYLFKKSKQDWRLKHELLFLLLFVLITFVFTRLFYLYVVVANEANPYSIWYFFSAIYTPALTVILPIIIIGRFAFGKYKDKKLEEQKIEIQGEGNYESLRLQLNNLICIQSSDNYIEVFYLNENQLKKTLIRNKLSIIENSFPELLRTHRSFIINPFHFQLWKTEKGKHFLMLSNAIEVPVSKTYLDTVKIQLNFTTA